MQGNIDLGIFRRDSFLQESRIFHHDHFTSLNTAMLRDWHKYVEFDGMATTNAVSFLIDFSITKVEICDGKLFPSKSFLPNTCETDSRNNCINHVSKVQELNQPLWVT